MFMMGAAVLNDLSKFEAFAEKYGEDPKEPDSPAVIFPKEYSQEAKRRLEKVNRAVRSTELIPRSFVVSLTSAFDAFLGQLLKSIYRSKPELLNNSERQLSLAQLNNLGSIDAAFDHVISKEAETVIRKSRIEQFKWMEEKFKLTLRTGLDSWPVFIELSERRNCFVHNDGKISDQYRIICNQQQVAREDRLDENGDSTAGPQYIHRAYECSLEIGIKLAHVLWRKMLPNEYEEADGNLIQVSFDLLISRQWQLAAKILDFACNTLKKFSSEKSRRILIVNHAQSLKWLGHNDKCREIIEREDWTATGDDFLLVVHTLKNEFEEATALMHKIGPEGEVPEQAYRDWPAFRELRRTKMFADTFEAVFQKPYTELDKKLTTETATLMKKKIRTLTTKWKEGSESNTREQEEECEEL